jgi:tRNA (guanine-N7-)-methyltransferase
VEIGRPDHHHPLRSFTLRRRSLGPSRQDQYQRLLPLYSLAVDGPPIDLAAVFGIASAAGPPRRYVLDIGFGYGDALIDLAKERPDELVVGVEVHTPGVAHVLDAIETHGLKNVRVVEGDVTEFVRRLPAEALHEVRVWFPDPWLKRRQHRRRLVSATFLDTVVGLLGDGGVVHVATDITDYARHTQALCDAHPLLTGQRVPRPDWRPLTSYERRGRQAGRDAVDLVYRKR